ncbi:MFS transporter [Rhodococcus opacus]|nr:MFS transporter [Rhodococcus opacus]
MSANVLAPPATGSTRSPALITATLAGCGVICSFMQTLMVPLVPELPRLLSTSPSNASWIVTATLLAGAVFTPISGRLGDIFGKKRVALVLLGAILVGSLLAAVTTTLIPMIVGRAFQGAGLGMISLGIGMLRDTIPPERLGRSVALMSSTLGVGAAVGMPLSAFATQHYNWHMLFWMSGALSVLGAGALWVIVPAGPRHRDMRFDVAGHSGWPSGSRGCCWRSPRAVIGAGPPRRPSFVPWEDHSCWWSGGDTNGAHVVRSSIYASASVVRCC